MALPQGAWGARLDKLDWVLLFLRQAPLDRVQLMKALFLFSHRSSRPISGFFQFEPYMYGPCSFELYGVLRRAVAGGFVSQPPQQNYHYAPYFLTRKGHERAEAAAQLADPELRGRIAAVTREVASLPFHSLLRRVYEEAPEFASKTVVKSALPT